MAANANSITTDETTRTVTIRQEEFVLKQETFRKGYHHVVYATTVRVKKGFVNPSCDLTVYAARVLVDREGGKIDVSGRDGDGFPASVRVDGTASRNGTHDGGDGGDGAAGSPGQHGGNVTVYAGVLQGGTLELFSRGGAGGRAQDGGHGHDGAQPPERPKPSVPTMVQVGWTTIDERHRAPKYDWSDDVDKIGQNSFWAAWLIVAHRAQSGADGGHGGHAGLAGTPGNGGQGGRIQLQTLSAPSTTISRVDVGGGKPGQSATHGVPGKGAAAGLGGKYLYKADSSAVAIGWSAYDDDAKWDKEWNTRNSKTFGVAIDQFSNLGVKDAYIETYTEGSKTYKKLRLRAASGRSGHSGGFGPRGEAAAPQVPTAHAGADGACVSQILDAHGELFREIPYPYLLMLQRSATAALLNRDDEGPSTRCAGCFC
jgi:hypothetical protein